MAALVISLDFELFWGVTDCADPLRYGRNVEGEWRAVPAMLELFSRYGIKATWATVGMAMCRDWNEWNAIRPAQLPGYRDPGLSNYRYGELARQHPRLFFARPLVQRILDTPGQELASHTYSHFYCNADGASSEEFAADMACARDIAAQFGVTLRSLVFPRNQMNIACLRRLPELGIQVVRGNRRHWLYRDGDQVPGGALGRAVRFADCWLAMLPSSTRGRRLENGLVDVPASLFLRPWSSRLARLETLRVARLCAAMSAAAKSDGVFHLWWHPHNFGLHCERNLALLETLLQHHARLRDEHGMVSMSMKGFAKSQDENEVLHA
jgi:peptidoglycan/xylan/chitin deacetylase (PgdA/CDA1 family)